MAGLDPLQNRHSINFQVSMKGRLWTVDDAYSQETLFFKKKKRRAGVVEGGREQGRDGGGKGVLNKFYIHKAADKVIVASLLSKKKVFFSPLCLPPHSLLVQKTLFSLNGHLLVTPLWAQGP